MELLLALFLFIGLVAAWVTLPGSTFMMSQTTVSAATIVDASSTLGQAA